MSVGQLVIGVGTELAFLVGIWFATRNWHSDASISFKNLGRVAIRSFAIAVVFAPTLVIVGITSLPAPAFLTLCYYLFAYREERNNQFGTNIHLALLCFVVFWIVASLGYCLFIFLRRAGRS